jgi:TonB family protein
MKNLKPSFLAFILFLLNSCVNQQPNNVVEQTKMDETSLSLQESPPSVSTAQKGVFEPAKKITVQKTHTTKCYLPTKITIEQDSNDVHIVTNGDAAIKLTTPKTATISNITPKKSQFFSCNTAIETVLTGSEGTTLTIPKDCFETETGSILRGVVKIELKEFLKPSDMVLANLVTQSGGKLLETGGMIYLNTSDSEDHNVKIRSKKDIKITLPKSPKAEEKQLFYGEKMSNGRINWTLPKPLEDDFNNVGFTIVEQNPEFPDGQAALFKFIEKKMVYPNIAWQNRIEGTVYVSFTVNRNGFINNVQVKRGIGGGCNEEAVRLVKSMPRWKPAKRNGVAVPTHYTLPIRFRLNNKNLPTNDRLIEAPSALAFANDTAKLDKFFEMEDTREYIMNTQKLGWINCDRFLNLQNTQRTDFVVWNNKPDAEICLVFKNYRTIVGAWSNSGTKAHFTGIPIGQPVFIVATSPDGGHFNISVTETVISKDQSTTIELKTVEKEAFEKELHRLDAVNQNE